jgi:hypothetical protein
VIHARTLALQAENPVRGAQAVTPAARQNTRRSA